MSSLTTPQTKRTVIVAEHETEVLKSTSEILKGEGFKVIGVTDGKTAWERIFQEVTVFGLPTIYGILSDFNVPKKSGSQLLNTIRESAYYTIPVTIMSNALDKAKTHELARLDVDSILYKPFTKETLIKELELAFTRRQSKNTQCAFPPQAKKAS